MNPQQTSIKHSALGWVKKSIDDNLSEIKTDLKQYIEDDDEALLGKVKERLGVIQGVLVMIEQYGAAMLTEEMVALADFISENRQEQGEQALEVMLRAVLQLPDYLEHIQSGHRDIPIAILPLLNDIRAVRNQDLFSEKLLFLPDLSMHQDDAEVESISEDQNQASKLLAKKLRPIYQLALVNVIKDSAVEESLKRLEKVCETLEERSFSEQIARIWWIVGALLESVSRQQLELGVSIKNLLGKVDALFRVILIIGERGLVRRQPIELIKNFLFYIAQPECDGPKAQAIKTAYRLEQFLPSESARSKVLDNIAGPNQALLKTVAEAMKADIEAVKSTLEVYVNNDLSKVEALKDLPQEMHIISDTLAMIGLGSQRQLIEAQIDTVKNIVDGKQAADEEQLLSMAAELLQVEQALDQMQKRQPSSSDEPRSEVDVSRDYELDNVLTAVVTAALDDIQKTKNAILEFIKDPSRGENIDLCVTMMRESRGALELLNQPRAVAVVDGLLTYLQGYTSAEFTEASRLDALSQVVVSLEYYLEALGEHRSDADSILDFADVQLQDLLSRTQAEPAGEQGEALVIIADEAGAEPTAAPLEVTTGDAADAVAPESEEPVETELPITPGETAGVEPLPDAAFEEAGFEVAETAASEAVELDPAEFDLSEFEVGEATAPELTTAEADEPEVIESGASEPGVAETEAAVIEVAEPDADDHDLVAGGATVAAEIAANDDLSAVTAEAEAEQPVASDPGDELESMQTAADEAPITPASEYGEPITTEVESIAVKAEQKIQVEPVEEELEVLKPGSDPDILEIYLEEAEEEAQNIARLQQDWMLHPEDENALKNIRRAFHTIKGSGRLVGAMKIGEFAWDFEQLLNRVIDKTIAPDTRIIDAVGKAAKALPQLVEELKTPDSPKADISYLRGLAKALAEFKAEQVLFEHTQQMEKVESPYDRITDGEETEWKGIGVGATTQIIPPDRITDALLEEIEPDTMRVDPAMLEQPQSDTGETEADATVVGDFNDTVLAQPPQIPAGEPTEEADPTLVPPTREQAYTEATDYAQGEVEATGAEIQAVELDDIEPVPREAIEVETVGEDFLGDDFAEDLDADLGLGDSSEQDLEALMEQAGESAEAAFVDVAEDQPQVEFESPQVESGAAESDSAPSPVSEMEPESWAAFEADAPEVEEISFETVPEPIEESLIETAGEQEQSPFAEEFVAEESGQPVAEEPIAEEPIAEEPIAEEPIAEEPIAEEPIAEEPIAEEPIAEEPIAEESTAEETPPDPFVDTTRSPVPGEEAEPSESTAHAPVEPTGLSFDPELLIIYQQEVELHLNILNSALDQAEQVEELIPGEDIYRALHTIHGASRTADISTIGELAGLLEKPLKSAIAQNMALDHEIVALYREGQNALQGMLDELVATRQLPPIPEALEVSLKALAEDFEEHTVEIPDEEQQTTGEFIDTLTMMTEVGDSEQDNELLTIFVDEANELLEMSDNTLEEWARQQAEDSGGQEFSSVMELQRYLHTLKGGARMAEIKEISDLSHEMESVFIAVIDGRVDKNQNLIDQLRDCFDLLHQQVVEAQQGQPLSDSSAQVESLRDLRLGGGADATDEALEENFEVDSEDIDIVAENLLGEPAGGFERPAQDVIKVRSDLLDNLVSSAGEVSIYRARMEQQVAGLGSHLGELGQTISRLKGQLRSLEAETDAQIHYSHRAESGRTGDFDPLEMDRYTMIQELSRSLSESVNDLSSLQAMLGEQVRDSETLLLQQSRVSTDLQDGLIKSRMVKFSGLLSRLRRLVRQSSQELGKKADLVVTGEDNEVDNKVLDRMVAPLEHIIRNALSHGIETPVERVKKGKPESGKITIDITRDGSDIVIRVSDDGAGVNIEKVRSRAIQLGLLDKSAKVSDADLVQYILEPGFSTAEHVTQLSGRGVGMDVVDIEIKQLGGVLQIETTPQGTTFTARLPFTLSINQAILVRTGEETYAIPLINIEGITRLDAATMLDYYRQQAPEIEYAGQQFALHHLAKLVDSGIQFRPASESEKQPVILSRSGDVRVALHVDEIIGNREIVVKTLGKQLSQIKGLAGASILADGSVVLILDINGLIRQSAANAVRIQYQAEDSASSMRDTVMVVDDSITMRRVASKLLERHNYEVVTAKDGVDALAQLQDVRPDVMLLDIEMPRMDGFELATHMQNEESYSKIPIIMITSRTGEKHRDRALEIGVTNYMGKPYQEDELIENIQNALGAR